MIHDENKIENLQIYPALLDELLLNHRQAIVLLNTDGIIIFCTDTAKLITGYEKEALVGRTAFDFLVAADAPSAKQQYEYLIRGNAKSFSSIVCIRNKQGDMIWIDVAVKNLLHLPGINAIFVLLKNSCDAGSEERRIVLAINAAKEEERAFIACELHDNVNQIITAAKLLVDGALVNDNNKKELLKLSSANLELVIQEIRSLSHSMASYQLNKHGLAFAIDAFIAGISKASSLKFKINLQTNAIMMLSNEQQLQVYRIIQEATNNILRHAEATLAEIRISRKDELIYLVIKDNGKGFSMNRCKPGMGLSSITNRVKILRGDFLVRTTDGIGCTIEIHFPT